MIADIAAESADVQFEPNNGVVVYNGTILTMAGGTFNPQESMAVKGDTIISVGSSDAVKQAVSRAGHSFSERDLGTQCIVPGFVEPHLHILSTAMIGNGSPFIDMTYHDGQTRNSVVESIKFSPHYGKVDAWIIGFGYDPSLVADHLEFHIHMGGSDEAGDLDKVAPTNPLFIINQSGHLAYCNTAAFRKASIGTKAGEPGFPVKDPEFERDPTKIFLNGVVKETAVKKIAGYLPQFPILAATIANVRPVLRRWAARGCTTVYDCGLGLLSGNPQLDIKIIEALTILGHFPRIRGALALNFAKTDVPTFLANNTPPPWDKGKVHVQGIKYWLDDSTQGFTAAVKAPYLNPPRDWPPCGTLNYPDETSLDNPIQQLISHGWQIVLHANGGAAIDQALSVLSRAFAKIGPGKIMHRLEHVTADISLDQLTRAVSINLSVTHLIAHVRKWGHTFSTWVLGEECAARIDPVKDDVTTGVTYSFHSDSPVSEADPLQFVDTAVTCKMDGRWGVLGSEQTVNLEEALRGITYNPGKQVGALDEVGSLEQGKKADFVILGKDPCKVPNGELRQKCEVVETWVGGVRVA